MEEKAYYLYKRLEKILSERIDEIVQIYNKYEKIINIKDYIDTPKFSVEGLLRLDNKDLYFIIDDLFHGSYNVPEVINNLKSYVQIKNSNNQVLLKSSQFKKKEELVEDIKKQFMLFFIKLNDISKKQKEFTNNIKLALNLVNNNINEQELNKTGEELIKLVKDFGLTDEECVDFLLVASHNISKRYEEIINEKNAKLSEKTQKTYKDIIIKVTKKRSPNVIVDIEAKSKEIINQVLNIQEIKEKLINNFISDNDIDDDIIYFYLIEQGVDLNNLTKDIVLEKTNEYIEYIIKDRNIDDYSSYISEKPRLKYIISEYFEGYTFEDIARICIDNGINKSQEECINYLKEKYKKEFNNKIDSVIKFLDISSNVIDNNTQEINKIKSSDNELLSNEQINDFRNVLVDNYLLSSEDILKIKEQLSSLKERVKNDIDLLFTMPVYFESNYENESNEERKARKDRYLSSKAIIGIVNEMHDNTEIEESDYYDLISVNLYEEILEKVLIQNEKLEELIDTTSNEEIIDEDLPVTLKGNTDNLLFMSDAYEEIKSFQTGDGKGLDKIKKILVQLNNNDPSFKLHDFRAFTPESKSIKKAGLYTSSGRTKERVFFKKIGNDSNAKTVIFMIDHKKSNNDNSQTVNCEEAYKKLNRTKSEFNRLVEAASNLDSFNEEKERQDELEKKIIKLLDKSKKIGGV